MPSEAATGNIVVTTSGETSNGVPFTFYPYPSITAISATIGTVGTPVTITGAGLLDGGGNGAVSFNRTPATILSQSSTSIQVKVPAGATTGPVSVFVNGNTIRSSSSFSVVPPPRISGLSPNYGAAGAAIDIAGANFDPTQDTGSVTVGGAPAEVVSWSNTKIVVQIPSKATTGNLVVTANETASNGEAFTFYPRPAITTVSPATGLPGTLVTITGSNLLDGGDNGSVTFNGTPAAIVSLTNTSIQVDVPAGATNGPVSVLINGVTVKSSSDFTVLSSELTISGLSPNYGAPSAPIVISGTGFGANQGNGSVTIAGATCSVTSWSNTAISILVPGNATTGNLVVTAGGVSSNGAAFTFYPFPTIVGISPGSGPVGTPVTITGINLLDGGNNAVVTFTLTKFSVVPAVVTNDTSGSIQLTVPTGAVTGRVVVKVNGVTVIADEGFVVTP